MRVFRTDRIAESLHRLGDLDVAGGHLDRAREAYGKSLEILKRLGDRISIAESIESIAFLLVKAGDLAHAVRVLAASAFFREEIETPTPPARRPQVDLAIAHIAGELGEGAFDAERERWRTANLDDAIDVAVAACTRDAAAHIR